MKRRHIVLAVLTVMLVTGLSVGTVWSYFTDTTFAEGSVQLNVAPPGITEENQPGIKKIKINNTSGTVPVWTRVRVYAAAALGASASGTNWSGQIQDWYEYTEPLAPGAQSKELTVKFALPDLGGDAPGALVGDEQNIVVIYECVPVSYDASGKVLPAKWN